MFDWLDGIASNFLFWKLVVMLAVVAVVSFINGYRERLGRPPLWPPQGRTDATPAQEATRCVATARATGRSSR
jgi:hypothetical protein